MPLLSVTRLRIRNVWFLPKFFLYASKSLKQAKAADGIIEAKTLADKNLTFWTVSLWRDEASMRRYMTSGAHKEAMPKLQVWCNEARTGNSIIEVNTLPNADVIYQTVLAGRASKLQKPNANHVNNVIAKPTFKV